MKKFSKGTLTTIVEDDDRRIADYRASGWKEEKIIPAMPTAADEKLATVIKDANDSEPGKKRKNAAPDKKVNDAIKANNAASLEGNAVDDGLIIGEGK